MKIYHSCFKFWRNFEHKEDYCWIAITKTLPLDYVGNVYRTLAPIGKNFDKAEHPFDLDLFLEEYDKLLKSLDRKSVIRDIISFSKSKKDIVLLNWEDMTKLSEGRIAFAWMFDMTNEQANSYDLETVLKKKPKKPNYELLSDSFWTI